MATYRCRIDDRSLYPLLDAIGALFGRVRAQLLTDLLHGGDLNDLKKDYQPRFGITARQFNAVAAEVRGKLAGAKELASVRMDDLRSSIRSTQKAIRELQKRDKALTAKLHRAQKQPDGGVHHPEISVARERVRRQLHGKRRRLHALRVRLGQLQATVSSGQRSICLGTGHLFDQQHHVGADGAFADRAAWKSTWQQRRSNRFTCIGSHEETSGNQSCTWMAGEIRLRVPDTLLGRFGRYVLIRGVKFPYGQAQFEQARMRQEAISYQFVRRERKGVPTWYLHAIVEVEPAQRVSRGERGVIGVDLNPSHLAVTETDAAGNPVRKTVIALRLYHRSRDQVRACIGEAVAAVAEQALQAKKPVAIEQLDFRKKRASLREASARQARLLSGFAYSTFKGYLYRRCAREGIEVVAVSPYLTSTIGIGKFGPGYRLCRHQAAALCIARRARGLSQRYRSRNATLPPVDGWVHGGSDRWLPLHKWLHESEGAGRFPSAEDVPFRQTFAPYRVRPPARAVGVTVPPARMAT